jgi:acyl carrier protein
MTGLQTRLTDCFAAVFPTVPTPELPTATIDTLPEWDSLASVTLLTVIEEEFAITIEPEQVEHLRSFDDFLRYLSERPQMQ